MGARYPRGTRLLLWLNRATGVGVQQLYEFRLLSYLVSLLDMDAVNPSRRPK